MKLMTCNKVTLFSITDDTWANSKSKGERTACPTWTASSKFPAAELDYIIKYQD